MSIGISLDVEIRSGNEAFQEMPEYVLAKMLRDIAEKLENGYTHSGIYDPNGNRVGHFAYDMNDDTGFEESDYADDC